MQRPRFLTPFSFGSRSIEWGCVMKAKPVMSAILVVLLLCSSRLTRGGEGQTVDLPQLTLEQKLDRSVRNTVGREVVGIAYAKSMGKTAEDFGEFMGRQTAFFWADIKEKGPVPFVQYWYRFLQTDRSSSMEIVSVTHTSVTARMSVYGVASVRALERLGVTVEEYARYLGKMSELLADYVGLDYSQELEGDWIVFTVAGRDQAATAQCDAG